MNGGKDYCIQSGWLFNGQILGRITKCVCRSIRIKQLLVVSVESMFVITIATLIMLIIIIMSIMKLV